jgi:hypothetical protein
MNELCSTEEFLERMKDILSKHIDKPKVFDGDVADILHVDKQNMATMKRRNKLPLKEILLFCDRCGLDPLKIIMKKSC